MLLLLALAVLLTFAYASDRALLASVANRLENGRNFTPAQHLEAFTYFAHDKILNPPLRQLPPLVQLYYRFNPLHPGPGDVLRWGSDYRGACGSHVRVVVAMLRAHGIPARPLLHLDNHGHNVHTVVEAQIDGRWVVADALYGIVFRRRDGALASAADMRSDHAALLSQTVHVPGYDTTLYNFDPVTHFNWNKVPVLLPAVRTVLSAAVGEDRVDQLVRPSIWMWPEEFYAVCCYFAAVVLAGYAILRSRAQEKVLLAAAPAAAGQSPDSHLAPSPR